MIKRITNRCFYMFLCLFPQVSQQEQRKQQQHQYQQQQAQQQQQKEPNRVQQQLPDWVHEQGNQAALIRAELTPPFVAIRRANGMLITGYMDGDEPIYLSTEKGSSSDDDGK